ncbi:hypothetical protein ACVW0I_005218 [Bradyrhizobium sp. LM6.11]
MTDQPKDQSRSEQAKAEQTKAEQAKSESGFQYSLSNLRPVTPPEKITLTFPDGARREYAKSITGLEIAKGISPSLAKRTVAMALDGVVSDLDDPIEADAKLELINRDDPRALELIRHDCAHVGSPKPCRRCGRARRSPSVP